MINIVKLIIIFTAMIIFFNGKKYDDLVSSRINIKVDVCLEGEDCGKFTPVTSSAQPLAAQAQTSAIQKVELSQGPEHTVKMLNDGEGGQMIFEPAVLKVSVGDTIHFKSVDAAHNSASIEGMIPEGAQTWAGQLSQDISVVLNTEGVYVYQCDPHLVMAMVGVIQVGEASNLDEIKQQAATKKSSFMMNSDRLDKYLSQL